MTEFWDERIVAERLTSQAGVHPLFFKRTFCRASFGIDIMAGVFRRGSGKRGREGGAMFFKQRLATSHLFGSCRDNNP